MFPEMGTGRTSGMLTLSELNWVLLRTSIPFVVRLSRKSRSKDNLGNSDYADNSRALGLTTVESPNRLLVESLTLPVLYIVMPQIGMCGTSCHRAPILAGEELEPLSGQHSVDET